MKETRVDEQELLTQAKGEIHMANFVVSLEGTTPPTVIKAMLGHTRRILKLLSPDPTQGILACLARAMGKETPTPSRRYDTIWDIDRLFAWISQNWGTNDDLPLEDLQTKTMILIMTFSACRLAELGRMERPTGVKEDATVATLHTVLKQQQTLRQQLVIRRITRTELCPVQTLVAWLRRAPEEEDGLAFHVMQRVNPPGTGYHALRALRTPDICPKFLKVMQEAGVPPQYTAYSVKHAVITKLYRMGATDEQVVAYGHWAKGSLTPRKWYNIATLEEEWLGAKLLGQCMGLSEESALEKFVDTYMSPARTKEQAEGRAQAAEALATPIVMLQKCGEAGTGEEGGTTGDRL
jgi:hypothetical protein